MKKLIPALCMLLVAACLMGTSTYAWFAANINVTASGMQVKAAADGGLAIASYIGTPGGDEVDAVAPGDAAYASSAAANWKNITDGATIKPTSNNGSGTWYTAGATTADKFGGSVTEDGKTTYFAGNYEVVTSNTAYYQKTKFRIKSLDQTAGATAALRISAITVTDSDDTATSAALNNALRVAVALYKVKADNTRGDLIGWAFYAPNYPAGTTGLKHTTGLGTSDATLGNLGATAEYTGDQLICGNTGLSYVLYNALDTNPIDVDVYVYYEGEDQYCTSNAAKNVDTLNVQLTFTAE